MKIALITHHFPPNFKAGAEQYAYRIAQGLKRHGHTIEVVCIESITEGELTPTCTPDTYEGLSVHRLRFNSQKAPNIFEWTFRNPELGQWVKDFLQTIHPDIVHINSGYLLGGTVPEAAYELGLPTILTLHDYWFVCPLHTLLRKDGTVCSEPVQPARCVWCSLSDKRRYRSPDIQLNGLLGDAFVKLSQSETIAKLMGVSSHLNLVIERRAYLKQVLEKVDLILSPSRFLIKKMEAYGFNSDRMTYLPLGLDYSHLLSSQPVHSSEKLRIGYLGQFTPHKGVHLLMEAFQKISEQSARACTLTLYGKVPEETPYGRNLLKIAENNPSIIFAGPYSNSSVGQILNNLDVVVVPSVWYENRPAVIVEAFATQTPVIATRLGGMSELITHNENGLLFEVGNVAELTEQLQRLLNEPELLPTLRLNIKPVPSIEEELTTLISLYESLLSTSANSKVLVPTPA